MNNNVQNPHSQEEEAMEFLTTRELADWLRVPEQTVHLWRYLGKGPRAYKVGRHLRFRRSDVEAWLAERVGPAPKGA